MKNNDDYRHIQVLKEMTEEAFQEYDKWKFRSDDIIKLQASYAVSVYKAITEPKAQEAARQVLQQHQRFWTKILTIMQNGN